MDAKPIFLAELPIHDSIEYQIEIRQSLEKKMPDYHVLIAFTNTDEIKCSAFYAKDLIETDFEEFKKNC